MQHADLPILAGFLPEVLGGNWAEAHLRAQMDATHEFLVLVNITAAQETVVGFAEFYCVLDECHLLNFAILRPWQQQGVAPIFMQQFLQLIRQRNCVQCLLEVRRSNHRAVRLYENAGFKHVGTRSNYYPPQDNAGVREDALLYSWSLSVS